MKQSAPTSGATEWVREMGRINDELQRFKDDIYKSFNAEKDADFRLSMKEFWGYIDKLNQTHKDNDFLVSFNDLMADERYFDLQRFLSSANLHFERSVEIVSAATLLKNKLDVNAEKNLFDHLDEFVSGSTLCAKGEIDYIQSKAKPSEESVMAMIGCGPLPVTFIKFAKEFPRWNCLAIDNNPEAIAYAKLVTRKFFVKNTHFEILNGKNFNYKDVDFTIISNVVTDKAAILNRIAATGKEGATVVIRTPIRFAKLLYEPANFRQHDVFFKEHEIGSNDSDSSVFLTIRR